jgi:hypothetical protein
MPTPSSQPLTSKAPLSNRRSLLMFWTGKSPYRSDTTFLVPQRTVQTRSGHFAETLFMEICISRSNGWVQRNGGNHGRLNMPLNRSITFLCISLIHAPNCQLPCMPCSMIHRLDISSTSISASMKHNRYQSPAISQYLTPWPHHVMRLLTLPNHPFLRPFSSLPAQSSQPYLPLATRLK